MKTLKSINKYIFCLFIALISNNIVSAQTDFYAVYDCVSPFKGEVKMVKNSNSGDTQKIDESMMQYFKKFMPENIILMSLQISVNNERAKIVRKTNNELDVNAKNLSDSNVLLNGIWYVYSNAVSKALPKWEGTITHFKEERVINMHKCKKSIWKSSKNNMSFEIWSSSDFDKKLSPFSTSEIKLDGGIVEVTQLDGNITYILKAFENTSKIKNYIQ